MFRILKRKTGDRKQRLKDVLGEFVLPTFPAVVMKAIEKIRDPSSTATEVAEILATDPGVSVKIIKTINSAAFASRAKVNNLSQAVAMLGMSSVESLVLSISVGSILPKKTSSCFDHNRFWRASVRRATLARGLAATLHPASQLESFTGGLLQDMAIPYLAGERPDEYAPILDRWRTGSEDLASIEREHLEWDHAEVATWLCGEWEFSENLTSAVGEHHGTMEMNGGCPPAVRIVSCILDDDENTGVDRFVTGVSERFAIPTERIEKLVEESFERAGELEKLIS